MQSAQISALPGDSPRPSPGYALRHILGQVYPHGALSGYNYSYGAQANSRSPRKPLQAFGGDGSGAGCGGRAMAIAPSATTAATTTGEGRRVALLVGINDYQNGVPPAQRRRRCTGSAPVLPRDLRLRGHLPVRHGGHAGDAAGRAGYAESDAAGIRPPAAVLRRPRHRRELGDPGDGPQGYLSCRMRGARR